MLVFCAVITNLGPYNSFGMEDATGAVAFRNLALTLQMHHLPLVTVSGSFGWWLNAS